MKKPNLLFVFADQWRRDAMGFMEKILFSFTF